MISLNKKVLKERDKLRKKGKKVVSLQVGRKERKKLEIQGLQMLKN